MPSPPLSHRAPTKPFCDGMNASRPPRHANLDYATIFDGQRWRDRHRRCDIPPNLETCRLCRAPAKSSQTSTNEVALSLAAHPNTYPGVHISISARHLSQGLCYLGCRQPTQSPCPVTGLPPGTQQNSGPHSDENVADLDRRRRPAQRPSALSQSSKEEAFSCSPGETE